MTLPIWWQVAMPHGDVLSGELTEEKFAANLWTVVKGNAPADYQDAERFFQRTHITGSMEQLLLEAVKRLTEGKGNATITLQTPFGGGKTHTLIMLWHFFKNFDKIRHLEKVKQLINRLGIRKLPKVRVAAFVGDAVDPLPERPPFTPMGLLMEQLGVYKEVQRHDKERISPGTDKLSEILGGQPTLLLLDELAIYSAALYGHHQDWSAVHTFWQQLTVAAGQVSNCVIIATLPTSAPYGHEVGAEALRQLSQIFGRVERPLAPVKGLEIYEVVRQRLFRSLGDEETHRKVASAYFEFYERHGNLFPRAVREVAYRERIAKAYPFHPLLIDLLRERWGTIEGFQRTRGVLRLLAQVVRDLHGKSVSPLIHPGDLDLSGEIRQMLLRVIDDRYDGVVGADITDGTAHAAEVDKVLGMEFERLKIATQLATTIFLASHHGAQREGEEEGVVGVRKGIEREWLRVGVWHTGTENAPVDEALNRLKERCWYLDEEGGLLFFGLEPSLEKIVHEQEERITEAQIKQALKDLLETVTKADTFKSFLFPESSHDIPDDESLKLIVMSPDFVRESDETEQVIRGFWEYRGETPRVYRNTLFFVVAERKALSDLIYGHEGLKRKLAMEGVKREQWERLNERKRRDLHERLQRAERHLPTKVLNAYRWVVYPERDGLKWEDMGTATVGEASLSQRVSQYLKSDRVGKLITSLTPERLTRYTFGEKERGRSIKDLRSAFGMYPHLPAVSNPNVVPGAVREGVLKGIFALRKGEQILLLTSVPDLDDDDKVLRWLEVGELTPQHIRQLAYGKKKLRTQDLREKLGNMMRDEGVLTEALREGEEKGLWKVRKGYVEFIEVEVERHVTVDELLDMLRGKEETSVHEVYKAVQAEHSDLSEEIFSVSFIEALKDLEQEGWQLEVDGQIVLADALKERKGWREVLDKGVLRRREKVKGVRYQFAVGWDKLGQLGQMVVRLVQANQALREKLQVLVIMSLGAEIPEEHRKRFEEGLQQLGVKVLTYGDKGTGS